MCYESCTQKGTVPLLIIVFAWIENKYQLGCILFNLKMHCVSWVFHTLQNTSIFVVNKLFVSHKHDSGAMSDVKRMNNRVNVYISLRIIFVCYRLKRRKENDKNTYGFFPSFASSWCNFPGKLTTHYMARKFTS
jgi:hypothetical protein